MFKIVLQYIRVNSGSFRIDFSFAVETMQYFRVVEVLGFQNNKLAKIIIGTSFAWIDLLVYVLGIAMVLIVEKMLSVKPAPKL